MKFNKAFLLTALTISAISLSACGNSEDSGKVHISSTESESLRETTEPSENSEIAEEIVDLHPYDFTLCFAGDISLDESAVTTRQLNASANGIYDCIKK